MYHDDNRLPEDGIPNSLGQYETWLKQEFDFNREAQDRDFKTLIDRLYGEFDRSKFFLGMIEIIPIIHSDYKVKTQVELFVPLILEPRFVRKSFNSFLEKSFRFNFTRDSSGVLSKSLNTKCLEDLYCDINDAVRSIFIVKYLDGVDFFIDHLEKLCKQLGIRYQFYYKNEDDGYYAAHFYISLTVDFYSTIKRSLLNIPIWIEIQITTQLQDVIRKFHHDLYASNRSFVPKYSKPWQWRYESDEFFTNYIGHNLHNIEGVIMEVRKRQEARNARV